MKILFTLAFNSFLSRKVSVILTIICLTLSLTLFTYIDNFRGSAKKSFFNNAQTGDLILGAKSGEIETLLYVIFQIGTPTNNISWKSLTEISKHSDVKWIIPISLGDSHKQYRVLGTTSKYFENIKYKNKSLEFLKGKSFNKNFDVVIGFDVAKKLNYNLNDKIIIAHGITSSSLHTNFPFKISGILQKTGTPQDKLIFVSLEALEAIHKDWKAGVHIGGIKTRTKNIEIENLVPKEVTGAIIKLNSKMKIFKFQREIYNYKSEPLQAIIPGLTLSKLWQIISFVENILLIISLMVVIASLVGMSAILYSNLHLRKNEISLLRVVGASPKVICQLLVFESFMISFISICLSILFIQILNIMLIPFFDNEYGIYLDYNFLSMDNILFFSLFLLTSILLSLFPAYKVFKSSIVEGI